LKAFVLIQTQAVNEPIAEVLRTLPEIESAEDLTGPYDAIALATADSTGDLFDIVVPKIRELPGVTRVLPAPLVASVPALLVSSAAEAA
jgi:DNA-binding Lrp family transcriptional regulator